MAIFEQGTQQIGAFGAAKEAGAMALGRVKPRHSFAETVDKVGVSAAIRAVPRVVVPTQQSAPQLTQGVNPDEGGLPKPVLIGLGVAGVALVGFLAFKLTR